MIRGILNIILSVALIFPVSLLQAAPISAEDAAATNAVKNYPKAKTALGALNEQRSKLSPALYDFLKHQIAEYKIENIPAISKSGSATLTFKSGSSSIPLKILNLKEHKFLLNGNLIVLNPDDASKATWNSVLAAMSGPQKHSLMELFLPSANAKGTWKYYLLGGALGLYLSLSGVFDDNSSKGGELPVQAPIETMEPATAQ